MTQALNTVRNALIWFCITLAVSVAAALLAHT